MCAGERGALDLRALEGALVMAAGALKSRGLGADDLRAWEAATYSDAVRVAPTGAFMARMPGVLK